MEESQGTKISSLSLCFNMVLSITGSAVLGIGAQMKTLGWFITPLLLFLGAAVTSEMVHLTAITVADLEQRTRKAVVSYQDFAGGCLGGPGYWISTVSSTLSMVGIIMGGLILESQNMQIVVDIPLAWPLGGDPLDSGRKWWAVIISSTTLVYCFVDMGSLLHKSGIIGVVLTCLCMALVYAGGFGQVAELGDFEPSCMGGRSVAYRSEGVNAAGAEGFQLVMNVCSVTSYIMFVFAVVVTLPTLRSTMQHKERVTAMSATAFFVVACEFVVIMVGYYWAFGNLGPQNIIDGMRGGRAAGWWATVDPWHSGEPTWVAKLLSWCVTLHLFCSDAIYVPCTVVAIEGCLPARVTSKRPGWVGLRIGITLLRLLVATVVQDFVKMTNLTSAAFVTLNNVTLPILAFYIYGPSQTAGWPRRIAHAMIFLFGIASMVFGTIGAIRDLIAAASGPEVGSFPRPDITQQCHDAYCAVNRGAKACSSILQDVIPI